MATPSQPIADGAELAALWERLDADEQKLLFYALCTIVDGRAKEDGFDIRAFLRDRREEGKGHEVAHVDADDLLIAAMGLVMFLARADGEFNTSERVVMADILADYLSRFRWRDFGRKAAEHEEYPAMLDVVLDIRPSEELVPIWVERIERASLGRPVAEFLLRATHDVAVADGEAGPWEPFWLQRLRGLLKPISEREE